MGPEIDNFIDRETGTAMKYELPLHRELWATAMIDVSDVSVLYAADGLNRLSDFDRGDLNANKDGIATLSFAQEWSLKALGNWDNFRQDANGNGTFSDSTDLDQTRYAQRGQRDHRHQRDGRADRLGDPTAGRDGEHHQLSQAFGSGQRRLNGGPGEMARLLSVNQGEVFRLWSRTGYPPF